MTNLDKMKNIIIEKIKEMDAIHFENLIDLLNEYPIYKGEELIDARAIFKCNKCEQIYGKCNDNTYDCDVKFAKYVNQEAVE